MPDLTLGNYELDEDGNGDLVIKDKNDTVVFKYDDTAGSFKLQVNFDFGSNDISNIGSLNTGKASVTDSTVIEAVRSANNNGISATTWKNLVNSGSEIHDKQNEFDESGSAQIVPNRDITALVIAQAQIFNATDTDSIRIRMQNITDGQTVTISDPSGRLSGSADEITESFFVNLSAGDAYEIQVQDFDNSFSIGQNDTYFQLYEFPVLK